MVLEDFSAAKLGRLTNGGDVLFARNRGLARLPQIRVRAMRYNSDKAGDIYRDMKSFEGPLHAIFEDAYAFIVRNTPTAPDLRKGQPKREDSPLYPEDAVRKALINAIAHRDYSSSSGGVSIHIFPQRLEIWNPAVCQMASRSKIPQDGHILSCAIPTSPMSFSSRCKIFTLPQRPSRVAFTIRACSLLTWRSHLGQPT